MPKPGELTLYFSFLETDRGDEKRVVELFECDSALFKIEEIPVESDGGPRRTATAYHLTANVLGQSTAIDLVYERLSEAGGAFLRRGIHENKGYRPVMQFSHRKLCPESS